VRRLGVEHAGQRVVDGEARGTDSVLRARVVHRAVVAKLVVEAAERVVAHNRIVEAQQRSDLRVKEFRPVLAAVLARRRHGSGARPPGKRQSSVRLRFTGQCAPRRVASSIERKYCGAACGAAGVDMT
jgi:hypothetical protein